MQEQRRACERKVLTDVGKSPDARAGVDRGARGSGRRGGARAAAARGRGADRQRRAVPLGRVGARRHHPVPHAGRARARGRGCGRGGGRRGPQGAGGRPRGAHHARELRALRCVRPRPAHPLPRHDGSAQPPVHGGGGEGVPVRQRRRVHRAHRRGGEPGRRHLEGDAARGRVPHRLRGRHRRRRGAQPGQGAAGRDGRGDRRRRHRPVGDPGGAPRAPRAASS